MFIISLVSLAFMGCGESGTVDTSEGNQGDESKGTIGISVLTLGNPFFNVRK